jgi:uncharacterized protein (DUF2141 family)
VSISPSTATVPTAGAQVFTATVTGADNATTNVIWSVNGIANGNAALGTIAGSSPSSNSTTGLYTAPANLPSPAVVTVTATSVADASKSASASVTIVCAGPGSISPAAISLALGQTQVFTASLCVAAGTAIAWDVNGISNGNSSVGAITIVSANSALYTAPAAIPVANPVTIHATATPAGGSPATAAATVTLTTALSIAISPPTATLAPSQLLAFTATVLNASDTSVTWTVNGIPNGNAAVGQICVSVTNPCASPSSPASGAVDYFAPAAVPPTNPVVLTAISHADPSKSATAIVSIAVSVGSVAITISPQYAFLAPSAGTPVTQQFVATVTGVPNTSVSWSLQSAVSGAGCAGSACGSITAGGVYAAPASAPSPNAINVTATSVADPTQSASAVVAITSGPAIETILPSSVSAGAVEGFSLSVQGVNFAAGSGSSSSVILFNGVARSTTCASANACATAVNPSDVQSPETIAVQIQNPASPRALSNPVPFVIQPLANSTGTLSLTTSQPVATGAYVTVVEPTTAAASSPFNVDFVGYLTGGNTCGVQGSPLFISRPASGTATTSICIHGTGLDPTFTYTFSGPGAPPGNSDIGVAASAITGLLPNMIELDLQLSSATLPGVRTLYITTLNNDRAVATGVLEVD